MDWHGFIIKTFKGHVCGTKMSFWFADYLIAFSGIGDITLHT